MKIPFLAAAFIVGACGQTFHLDEALTLAPYDLQESGRILVDARVNGYGPFPFALDTAASVSSIFEDFRDALALEVVPNVSANVHGAVASGEFPMVAIDRIEVGSEAWVGPELVVLPDGTGASRPIAGILGIDFLRRYGFGFSARDRVVRLYSPDLVGGRAYRGWAFVPLSPAHIGETSQPLFFLEIEIDGSSVPALFDLGSGLNLMNTRAAQHLRLTPRRAGQDALFSGVLETAPILARLTEEVMTASIHWRDEEFLIADTEIFSTLLYEDRPLAIVGAGMFNQRDFVIDFVRNRLLVRVSMNEAER